MRVTLTLCLAYARRTATPAAHTMLHPAFPHQCSWKFQMLCILFITRRASLAACNRPQLELIC